MMKENPNISIKLLTSPEELACVYRLTHDAYVREGYIKPLSTGKLVHYPHLDNIPETSVLLACVGRGVVGTNSLTLDGRQGLHVDGSFKEACDRIRAEGKKLAASWRIVTAHAYRARRQVIMRLITETIALGLAQGVETCLFTFHPAHEKVYQRLLNAKTVARGEISSTEAFRGPAVFMRCDTENLPERYRHLNFTAARHGTVKERPEGALS